MKASTRLLSVVLLSTAVMAVLIPLMAQAGQNPEDIAALIQGLKDPDWNVRLSAAQRLGNAGSTATTAVFALVEALDSEDDGVGRVLVVNAIVTALGKIGPDAAAAIPSLTRALKDADSGVRQAAAVALGKIGPGLRSRASDPGCQSDVSAGPAAGEPDSSRDTNMSLLVSSLALALGDENNSVRKAAAESIGAIGPEAKDAIPALVGALQDPSFIIKNAVIGTLKKLGPEAIRGMVEALQSGDEATSKAVVSALGKMGPDVIPVLEGALKDGSAAVRKAAADTLGQMGSKANNSREGLLVAVGDADPGVRQAAIAALSKIGVRGDKAISALTRALGDDSWQVRQAAAKSLGQMGPEAMGAMNGLIGAMGDDEPFVRSAAAKSIEQIDPDGMSRVVIPELIKLMNDEDREVRRRAVIALRESRIGSGPVVEALMKALGDSDEGVRTKAVLALGDLGPAARESVAALISMLEDDSEEVRTAASTALASVSSDSLAPALMGILEAGAWPARLGAARVLDGMKVDADEVNSIITRLADQLMARTESLPDGSSEQTLKRASLEWGIEDALSAASAGFYQRAVQTMMDVDRLMAAQIGSRHEAPRNLFPEIPDAEHNPFLKGIASKWEMALNAKKTYPKGEYTPTKDGWFYIKLAEEAEALAYVLCHPQSPLKDDPRALKQLMRNLDAIFEFWVPGHAALGDFGVSDEATHAYLLLNTVYPDLILPSKKMAWEAGIRANADRIMEMKAAVFKNGSRKDSWLNADVRYMNALLFSGLVLDKPEYLEAAADGLTFASKALLPDGGFTYVGDQNETFTYHEANIIAIAKYYLTTGDPLAKQLIVDSEHYYPLGIIRGVAEYYTAASWKPYWNMTTGARAAYIVASLTGSGQNYRLAQKSGGDFLLSFFYRADLREDAAPDNYLIFDRNIIGPRGRFGNFSFAATTRDPSINGGIGRGKSTFVGAMVLSDEESQWPLNAALQDATSEIKVQSGEDDLNRKKYRSLSQDEHNAVTIGTTFSGVTTRYTISDKMSSGGPWTPIGWQGSQQWILTPDRLVGMLEVEALSDQKAYSVDGTLKLVSGRSSWGNRKEFVNIDANTFGYGDLVVRVYASNYASITTEYTDTYDGDAKKSGRIVLHDPKSLNVANEPLIDYPKGTRYYFLVEIKPSWSQELGSLEVMKLPNGLKGFVATEDDRTLWIIHNPTDVPLDYSAQLQCPWPTLSIHRSTDWGVEVIPVRGGKAEISLSIEPNSHFVVINSSNDDDHRGEVRYYEDVFVPVDR